MAPLTLVIGNKNYSSWSLRPWLLMKHLGVQFDEVLIPLDTADIHEDVEKYGPSGRVPVLRTGAVRLGLAGDLRIRRRADRPRLAAGAAGARGRALGVRGDALRLHQSALAVAHERPRPQPPHRGDRGAGGRHRAHR